MNTIVNDIESMKKFTILSPLVFECKNISLLLYVHVFINDTVHIM